MSAMLQRQGSLRSRPGGPIPSPASEISVAPSSSGITTESVVAAVASHRTTSPGASSASADEADLRCGLNFSSLSLTCPIDVESIQNRWLNPFIEQPDQKIKKYPPMIARFVFRILKSYAAMAARSRVELPFVHPTLMEVPRSHLATCMSLARVSDNPRPGSEAVAAAILQREMDAITVQDQDDADDLTALAAFQAYLIYILILFFRLKQGPSPFFRSAMTTLQGLACVSSRMGLVCAADATHTRPRWEEWIVAESKRRSLYVMYLLDNVLSDQKNLPTYLGTELRGLPVPSSKALWQAPTRARWEKKYNVFLAEWSDNNLAIDELWPIPPQMDDAGIARRRRRVDHWLENLDEFGTMLLTKLGVFLLVLLVALPETLRSLGEWQRRRAGEGRLARGVWLARFPLRVYQKTTRVAWDRAALPPVLPPPKKHRRAGAAAYSEEQMSITAMSSLFKDRYGLSEMQIGLTFIANGVGCILGTLVNGQILDADYRRVKAQLAAAASASAASASDEYDDVTSFPIEKARLRLLPVFSLIQCLFILLFGWTIRYPRSVPIAIPIISTFATGWAAIFTVAAISTYLVDVFPNRSAAATASLNLARCLFAAGGTRFVMPMIGGIDVGWTFTICVAVKLVALVGPLVQYRYDGEWRMEMEKAKAAKASKTGH